MKEKEKQCPECKSKELNWTITIPERTDDTIVAICKSCGRKIKNIELNGKSIWGIKND